MDTATTISIGAMVVAGVTAFANVKTRVDKLEEFKSDQGPKMDRVLASLSRIEGRLGESDRQDGFHKSAHGA